MRPSKLPTTHSAKSFKRRSPRRHHLPLSHGARRKWRGDVALQAISGGFLTASALESARRVVVRCTSRQGRLWRLAQAHHPVSGKPIDARMGKGKGLIDYYVAPIRAGQHIFELGGITTTVAAAALRLASTKLAVRTKVVIRNARRIRSKEGFQFYIYISPHYIRKGFRLGGLPLYKGSLSLRFSCRFQGA
jgi:large subunit ribosomal protein L16